MYMIYEQNGERIKSTCQQRSMTLVTNVSKGVQTKFLATYKVHKVIFCIDLLQILTNTLLNSDIYLPKMKTQKNSELLIWTQLAVFITEIL